MKEIKVGYEKLQAKIPTLPVSVVYEEMRTCAEGLTQEAAAERLVEYGLNKLQEAKGKPLYIKFLANFTHMMAMLIWVGGVMAIIAQMPQLAIAIWMVNIINGLFSFWQEYRAEKATEALMRMLPTYTRVMRDREEKRILADELVPGDVVLLAEGEKISADCRLVEQSQLRVDQSTLTGESRPVSKITEAVVQEGLSHTEIPNLIFAGTNVASGTAKAVVLTTGMHTEFGKIAGLTQSMEEQLSPLQKELKVATRVITYIAVAIGILFFILAVAVAGLTLAESFIFAIGMIVAFVPEGLLPTVTLALAMGSQRMVKRHALIKRLSAVETLGCTSVICTDKTGTLTQNEMTVRSLWLPNIPTNQKIGRTITVTGTGYEPIGKLMETKTELSIKEEPQLYQLVKAAYLCNNSRLLAPTDNQPEKEGQWTILGDPTEACLRVLGVKSGLDVENEERQNPRLYEVAFDSRRKRMSTIHYAGQASSGKSIGFYGKNSRVAFVKGAPKETLDLCTRMLIGGEEVAMDETTCAAAMAANDEFASDGLRVLAVARRTIAGDFSEYTDNTVEHDLVFLGLIAMMDPPRQEVAEAVEKCHHAGIRIVMITGDYGLTAESIARRIGIVTTKHPRIITGFELDSMSEEDLEKAFKDEVIFARVAPEHKLKVVSALQKLGEIVAVTGDGVNDAPALKKADIGVAMGISGTDVAKEAASMILTDDNFASIVNAVEEGRAVYANIKKFTTYIFTSNTPEAVPFIMFAFSAGRIPLALNVMHILAIDLGTDIMPALGLGAEPPEPGMMDRPPRNIKEHVITGKLLFRAYPYLGMVQSAAAIFAFYYIYWMNGFWGKLIDLPASGDLYRSATAMALAAVVFTQIGNLFAQRSETVSTFKIPLFKNRLLWLGIGSELVLIFLIVYSPFMHTFIGTNSFPLSYWFLLSSFIPLLLVADEIRKWFGRKSEQKKNKKVLILNNKVSKGGDA
jgi:P-type Ca2+ transporter type 2C